MNLLYLRNGRPDESRCWTEKQGVGQCIHLVNKAMMDQYGIQMDEAVVEQVLRTGAGDMQEKYMHVIERSRHGGRLLFMKNMVQNSGAWK